MPLHGSTPANDGPVSGVDARSVANFMIEHSIPAGIELKHVAIQKLMYFAHATYLRRYKVPLVSGYFEAWEFGPVHRAVYDCLKQHRRTSVREVIERVDPFTGEITSISAPEDSVVRNHLAHVMTTLGHVPPGRLIEMSHVPGGPWDYIWNISKTKPVLGNRISDSVTLRLFPRLKAALADIDVFGDTDEAAPVTPD